MNTKIKRKRKESILLKACQDHNQFQTNLEDLPDQGTDKVSNVHHQDQYQKLKK